jgi:preprotein translocase subunit SecB
MPRKPKKIQHSLTSPNDSEYTKFLNSLALIGLALKSSSASVDRKKYWELNQKKNRSSRKFNEQYRISRIEDDFFESQGVFEFIVGAQDSVALRVESTFEVHIHAAKPISREMVERFTNAELRLILLPYARHFLTNITAQMQIPPIVLPLANDAR